MRCQNQNEGWTMRKIKVSVIIPVYNTEKYLEKCLDSVCNQTLSDIEIICINDASTDNSLEVLKQYAATDNRIKVISFEENKGAAAARNTGIEIATGEYIGFVDSDDYPDLDFYEKLYQKAIETGADAAKGNYKNADNSYVDKLLNDKIKEDKNNFAYSYCSAIFKREIISKNNIRFPNLSDMEDPVFTVQFALLANKVGIVDTYINIRTRENSITSGYPELPQIKDKFEGLSMIQKLLNTANISSKSYCYVLGFWFINVIQDSLRNNLSSTGDLVKLKGINFFQQIKYKEEFKQYVKNIAPSIYKLFLTSSTPTYAFDIERLKDLIDNHDIISFDIFDTLLLRPFLQPTDLFAYLGLQKQMSQFAEYRQFEEKMARVRVKLKHKDYEDVTFDEIYAGQLNKLYPHFKELELKIEAETLTQNKEIYEAYKYALDKKKTIIITSDMYLSKDFLIKVLSANGYDNYFKIYVSSEIRKTKSTGNLYKYIINDLAVPAGKILHIGDNYQSDIVNANKAGIDTFYYQILRDRYLNSVTNEKNRIFWQTNKDKTFNTVISLQVFNDVNPKNVNYWYKLGYQYGGPLVLAFMQTIIDIAKIRELTDLFFVARDGYILNKIYPLLKGNCKAKNHYIYAQRQLSRLCLQENTEYNEFSANEYKKYIDSVSLLGNKIGLVDTCTRLFSAQKLIEQFLTDKDIIGIYLAVELNYQYNYINLFGKSGGTVGFNWDLIELLMTSPEDPIVDMLNGKPVFLQPLSSDEVKRHKVFSFIEDGELDFVNDYIKYMKANQFSFQLPNVLNYLVNYWENLDSSDKYFLSQVKHASNVEQSNYKTLLYSNIVTKVNNNKELINV